MLNPHISLSNLTILLNQKFGKGKWASLEPETILLDLEEFDPLLMDKIRVVQLLSLRFSEVLALPEFILWLTSVANNEPANFEHVDAPTSLELAWMIKQVQWISVINSTSFEPSDAMIAVVSYFLKEDGFSEKVAPFDFLDNSYFTAGQTPEDTTLKQKAIAGYITKMKELSHA